MNRTTVWGVLLVGMLFLLLCTSWLEASEVILINNNGLKVTGISNKSFKGDSECAFYMQLKMEKGEMREYYYAKPGMEKCKGKYIHTLKIDTRTVSEIVDTDAYATVLNGIIVIMHKQGLQIVDPSDKTIPDDIVEELSAEATLVDGFLNLWTIVAKKGYMSTPASHWRTMFNAVNTTVNYTVPANIKVFIPYGEEKLSNDMTIVSITNPPKK